jgi:hypothetical protein
MAWQPVNMKRGRGRKEEEEDALQHVYTYIAAIQFTDRE